YEVADAAIGLAPDLGPGGRLVSFRIGRIEVLVWLKRAWDLAGESVGNAVVALRALARNSGGTDDDLGAVRAQQRNLFNGHLVGHDADEAIALQRGGNGQTGAGVTRGRLDDCGARSEFAGPFGGLDHGQADA